MSVIDDEARRARQKAMAEFLDGQWPVLAPQEGETEGGPFLLTGAVLMLRMRDAADPDSEQILKIHSPGLGWSEQLGMVETSRLALQSAYLGAAEDDE